MVYQFTKNKVFICKYVTNINVKQNERDYTRKPREKEVERDRQRESVRVIDEGREKVNKMRRE